MVKRGDLAKLTNSDGNGSDAFGISVDVSLDGNTIVAGTRQGFSPGAAYFFAKPVGGWATASEDHSVSGSDGMGANWFGNSTSLSGDGTVAVVGAPRTTIDASTDQGAAYVFTGSAATPRASVSASSLTFETLPIGSASGPQTVTVTNVGSAPLQVSGVSVTDDFSSTQNCVFASPIAPGASYFLDGATGGIIVVLQTAIFLAAFFLAPKHGMLAARRRAAEALEAAR